MSLQYFQKFQTVGVDLYNNGEKMLMIDILQRVKIRDILKDQRLVFYTYQVKDGETPEVIASKLYGDSSLHWIVLLSNDVVDAQYLDWPLSYDDLNKTIQKKYGTSKQDGLIYAYSTIDHYEDKYGSIIDEYTYLHLPASERMSVSVYDQEYNKNEQKRIIKLLDKKYAQQIDNELTEILKDATV